jgi:hypothetical protein
MTTPTRKDGSNDRRVVRLGPELEKVLSAYASAAIAAGVSLLAITGPAEAKIVYTPADVTIPMNGPLALDLNHDGITDFVLSNVFFPATTYPSASFASLNVSPGAGSLNEFWGRGVTVGSGRNRFASALKAGLPVGANKFYFHKSPKGLMADLAVAYVPAVRPATPNCSSDTGGCYSNTMGQWMYTKNRYLGLQFTISGQVHYGWARIAVRRTAVNGSNSITAVLTGYAYETIPNKPIITGKTKGPDVITLKAATLGRLAQGASGLSAWTEKK